MTVRVWSAKRPARVHAQVVRIGCPPVKLSSPPIQATCRMHESSRVAPSLRRSRQASRKGQPCGPQEPLFGNKQAATEWAHSALELSTDREVEYGSALAFVIAGDSSHAQALADQMEKQFPEDTAVRFNYLPTLRAVLALNRAEPQQAVE